MIVYIYQNIFLILVHILLYVDFSPSEKIKIFFIATPNKNIPCILHLLICGIYSHARFGLGTKNIVILQNPELPKIFQFRFPYG